MDAAALTRSWPALAAVGAALLQLALGAGAVTATDGGPPIRVAALALIVLGAAALVWGVATLAHGRAVLPRLGIPGSMAGIAAVAVVLVVDPGRTSVAAAAAASGLLVIVGVWCATTVRRTDARGKARGRTGLIGIVLGAAMVSALVTPALAATEVGRLTPSHDEHAVVTEQHGH